MTKARSRLQTKLDPTTPATSLTHRYLKYLPTLLLSAPFWFISFFIVVTVPPSAIEDFIFPNSYLPLVFSIWLALLFSFTFLFLRTRRGLAASTALTLVLWLHLQQVELTPMVVAAVIVSLLGPLILIELLERFFPPPQLSRKERRTLGNT